MGNIDYMKDDLKKLVDMSQGSYIHDNMNKDHAMEEATVEHSAKDKKGKEKEQAYPHGYYMHFCFLVPFTPHRGI